MAGKRGHKPKSSSAAAAARSRGAGCDIIPVVDDLPAGIPVAPDELAVLEKFLDWAMTKGQNVAPSLSYAPLPKPVLAKVKEKIKTITLK